MKDLFKQLREENKQTTYAKDVKDQHAAWTAGDYAKDKTMTGKDYAEQHTKSYFENTKALLDYLERKWKQSQQK